MASKGGITITQDELMRMKMRANLVPTCIYASTQPTQNRTERHTCSRRVRRGRTSGPTTSRTSRSARKRRGTKNSRRRSWSADASTRRSAGSSRKSRRSSSQRPTPSCSRIQRRCAPSIANFCTRTRCRAGSSRSKSRIILRRSRKSAKKSTTRRPSYFIHYVEPDKEGRVGGAEAQGAVEEEAERIREEPAQAAQVGQEAVHQQVQGGNGGRTFAQTESR